MSKHSRDGFHMKMFVQCHECATSLEFMIVNISSRGDGDLFQISVHSCPFCEELRRDGDVVDPYVERGEEDEL